MFALERISCEEFLKYIELSTWLAKCHYGSPYGQWNAKILEKADSL